jgi:hypothetical protein
MTDQQMTGALVLAAMFVIFLGVWFFGHPDDRKNSLRRMGVVLRFLHVHRSLWGNRPLYRLLDWWRDRGTGCMPHRGWGSLPLEQSGAIRVNTAAPVRYSDVAATEHRASSASSSAFAMP